MTESTLLPAQAAQSRPLTINTRGIDDWLRWANDTATEAEIMDGLCRRACAAANRNPKKDPEWRALNSARCELTGRYVRQVEQLHRLGGLLLLVWPAKAKQLAAVC